MSGYGIQKTDDGCVDKANLVTGWRGQDNCPKRLFICKVLPLILWNCCDLYKYMANNKCSWWEQIQEGLIIYSLEQIVLVESWLTRNIPMSTHVLFDWLNMYSATIAC